MEVTSIVPNAKSNKLPDSVVHWVTDDFAKGIQKTTIPYMDKLNVLGQGGQQPVEENEETPQMRYKTINYNLQRKGVTLKDMSVDGDLTDYYDIGSNGVQLLTDYFTELSDYNFQRALVRGADQWLTDDTYWTGQTLTSAPVTPSHHPSVLVNGGTAPITWSVTDATYDTAIETAAKAMTVANVFNLAALDSMIFQAGSSTNQKLQKLSWKSGANSINFVAKLSEQQSQQLTTATGSGTWKELMTDAGARGVDNRAITGIVGTYKKTLVITDERSPLFDGTDTLTPETRYQYYKITDGRTPTATTGAGTADGTFEVAAMLGKGAIGAAKIHDLNFNSDTFDYGFSEGMAASQSCGCERMDLVNTALTARPLNQSSFLYLTASPTISL